MIRFWQAQVLVAALVSGCAHQLEANSPYTLTVLREGTLVFGPAEIAMENVSIPLGRACAGERTEEDALLLELRKPEGGYFFYSCSTACSISVREAELGELVAGKASSLDCLDPDLLVLLRHDRGITSDGK